MQVSEFTNVNEIADLFPNIRLIKQQGFVFDKSHFPLYKKELKEKGYLLLRNFISPNVVEGAASIVDAHLVENGYMKIDNGKPILLKDHGVLLTGYKPVTHHEKFLRLVEGNELKYFFKEILGEEPFTLETKWVRVLGPKEYTDTHSDFYRFKKLGLPVYTCWIPLMDQGIKEGTLAICQGKDSYQLDFEEETLDQQEIPKGFLDSSAWVYSDYKVGDVVIFDIRTIHASFRNDSDIFRKNTDTRWMPKSLANKFFE